MEMINKQILVELIEAGKVAERKLKDLEEREVTYSIGDRFKKYSEKYILTPSGHYGQVILCSLVTGNGWSGNKQVLDCTRISETEMKDIFSTGKFTRYWDSQKKVLLNEDGTENEKG